MSNIEQTLGLLKWSIENSNSLWQFLHLVIIAVVGGAWACRKHTNDNQRWYISVIYMIFAIVNLYMIVINQKSALVSLEVLKQYYIHNYPNDVLLKSLQGLSIAPITSVSLFHLFIDIVVITAIIIMPKS